MSKYHAQPTIIDGIRFDSKAEANRYGQLQLAQRAGEIEGLQVHPRYTIWQHGREKIQYEGDFYYLENGEEVVEDVKGVQTPVFRLKAKMFRAMYPDIRFVVLGSKRGW